MYYQKQSFCLEIVAQYLGGYLGEHLVYLRDKRDATVTTVVFGLFPVIFMQHARVVLIAESLPTQGQKLLKVARVTGAAYSGNPMDQFLCASLFPHPLLVLLQ